MRSPAGPDQHHVRDKLNEALALQGTDLRRAIEIAEATYRELQDDHDHTLKCHGAYVLGSLLRLSGSAYERAEALLLSAEHPSMSARERRSLFVQLGQLYLEREDLDKADHYLELSLKNAPLGSDPIKRADVLLNLANLRSLQHNPAAKDLYDEALCIYSDHHDEEGMAITLTNYGMLFHQDGRSEEALETLTRAATIFDSIDQPRSKGIVLHKIASVQLALGDVASAASSLQASLVIAERERLLALQVDGLRLYANIKELQNEVSTATELREEADALAAAIGR
jgi:tetratricopeptide (TPR) repeat protein